jgi:4-amino-4-deoxy-L-arabinose transferase-like glycosyltransferase
MLKTHNSKLITQNSKLKTHHSQLIHWLLLLALGITLHGLAADSFWGDEIFTATFANQSPAAVIQWTAGDIHPPLYYLLAGGFARLTVPPESPPSAASDWLWRFPSVLAGVLTVAVTYRLARQLAGLARHPAPLPMAHAAALLLALAPIALKYGQEARMHTLFMALSALATWLFFRAMHRPRWPRWLAYAIAITATLYTMYFGFLILAAHAVFAALSLQNSKFTPNATQYKFIKITEPHPPTLLPLSGEGGTREFFLGFWGGGGGGGPPKKK